MVEITDIEKLRPELLDKSEAELERLAAEIAMAQAEKRRRTEAAERTKRLEEAGDRVARVIEDVKWLHDSGMLSQRVAEAFTRSDGQFNPATYLRVPRAEDVVVRAPRAKKEGPRRLRRVRDPETGELVPSKAMQEMGVG
jgi:hypothetical protein